MKVTLYDDSFRQSWTDFLEDAINGTLLHHRDFIDYHKHRFTDSSLIFSNKGKIIGLLPANISDGVLNSHGGLTYGGLVVKSSTRSALVMEIFERIITYCQNNGISMFKYSPIPTFLQTSPFQSDMYAMKYFGGFLDSRSLNSVITLDDFSISKNKKRAIKKAEKSEAIIGLSENWTGFWPILEQELKIRHAVSPVHSIDEILHLRDKFPERIKLFVAEINGEIVSGTVLFLHENTVHTQYLASSLIGRENGTLDKIIFEIMRLYASEKKYLSLGISTESNGKKINYGLINFKEGFGANSWIQDRYIIEIN